MLFDLFCMGLDFVGESVFNTLADIADMLSSIPDSLVLGNAISDFLDETVYEGVGQEMNDTFLRVFSEFSERDDIAGVAESEICRHDTAECGACRRNAAESEMSFRKPGEIIRKPYPVSDGGAYRPVERR